MKLLGIERSSRFSPNSTARDKAIFNAVADELRRMGHLVDTASEDNATAFAGYEWDATNVSCTGWLKKK